VTVIVDWPCVCSVQWRPHAKLNKAKHSDRHSLLGNVTVIPGYSIQVSDQY